MSLEQELVKQVNSLQKQVDGLVKPEVSDVNARFERIFGNNKPANAAAWQIDPFYVDTPASNRLGFETNTTADSDSYSPSAPFSKSNSGSVYFFALNHYLRINTLVGSATLIWTSSTGKRLPEVLGQFSVRATTTYGGEIRVWGVQSPGAGDTYWALRFILDTTKDWPWRIRLIDGTGVTFGETDGTSVAEAPFNPFTDVLFRFDVGLSAKRCVVYAQEVLSQLAQIVLDYTSASTKFATTKTMYVYTATSFQTWAIQHVDLPL